MNNILSFTKGITRTPSDLLCEDGDLAECINLEVKDQELVPMELPVKLPFTLNDYERLVYVHNIQSISLKNYMVYNTNTKSLAAFHFELDKEYYSFNLSCGDITNVVSLGNTLVIYTANSVNYVLFKDQDYHFIGDHIPNIDLSFNLEGDLTFEDEAYEIKDYDRNPDYNAIHSSHINKFKEEKIKQRGKFIDPFFVRYALLLYNGEYVCHSSPILMLPSTYISPHVFYYPGSKECGIYFVGAYAADIVYKTIDTNGLGNWTDIIKGVGVFITRPTPNYDPNNTTVEDNKTSWVDEFVGRINTIHAPSKYKDIYGGQNEYVIPQSKRKFQKQKSIDIWTKYIDTSISGNPSFNSVACKELVPIKEEDFRKNLVSSMSAFYLISNIDISRILSNSSFERAYDEGVNPAINIEQNIKLGMDYMTNDILIPKFASVYNGRLNIANITRKLFKGYSASSMMAIADGAKTYKSYVQIRSIKDIIVKSSSTFPCSLDGLGFFVYYPDTDAKVLTLIDSNNKSCSFPLAEHPFMNGSYALQSLRVSKGYSGVEFTGSVTLLETDNSEEMPNKLFTSDINNPFYFPLAGINTIGTGEILGITALTRPISPGQYGTFPLMAFCTDGNFAMKVDEEGFYSGISPLQEDIILGNDKITPLENSILVITQKGIMHTTQGNDMVKIAGQLDGKVFDISTLKNIDQTAQDTISFHDYLKDSRMAYSYSTNRVFIYNPSKNYVYVYSFDNGTISKLCINEEIINHVIDYPNVIIETKSGKLYNLYEREDRNMIEQKRKGFALTRPLKFGGPLTLKTIKHIRSIVTRLTKTSSVKYRIYASNDDEHYVSCSRYGRPYKYYRIAMYTDLLPKEAFSGVVLVTEERRTNKLR